MEKTEIRHIENYRDTTVLPGAKKWSLFLLKTNDSPDSTCHLGQLTEKINAKSHQTKKLVSFPLKMTNFINFIN